MFHINPETGTPNRCQAKIRCPFGDLNTDHYKSREEAILAWEARNETLPDPAKKSIILSDIDGTLVKSSLVLSNAVELHDQGYINLGGTPEQWKQNVKNEELIVELADKYRLALSGKTVAFVKAENTINRLLTSDKNFYSTLKRLIQHKKEGSEVVLISGSPDFLVRPFAEKFGFKFHASTYHKDEQNRFTGEIELMAGAKAKEAVIADLNVEHYNRVIGLGDTASDAPLLETANHSVIVDPTEETLSFYKERSIKLDEIVKE